MEPPRRTASLTLENLPKELHRRLKRRAIEHHRSLNREIIACLERVVMPRPLDPGEVLAQADLLRERSGAQVTQEEIDFGKHQGGGRDRRRHERDGRPSSLGTGAFITGASSGIGLELARQLAARGARLGLLALPGDDLARAADGARAAGAAEVLPFGSDVRDRAAVRQAVHEFAKTGDGLDLFIGCAGVDDEVPIDRFDAARSEFLYDVNLKGLMFGANAALEVMLARGQGHIVGIASLAGWRILPLHADYRATKCAVEAYLESLRVRLRGRGITVTTVSPGFVRTPMVAGNKNPMPFAVEADDAARRILRAIDRRKSRVAFSRPLAWGARLMRALPDPLWRLVLRFL